MRPRVVITRPEPGASSTALALRAAGYEPVMMPLSRVLPLSVADGDVADVQAVAATSANGLRHAGAGLLDRLRDTVLFAVGDATTAEARRRGFRTVVTGPGDARGLAELIAQRIGSGQRVAYLCGRTRKADLEANLASRGINVVAVETYAAEMLKPSVEDIARLGRVSHAAVLIHSQATAQSLADLGVVRGLERALHVCISADAAMPLDGRSRIAIATVPTEAAMLALLAGD